jgi:ketosteroid isomerase-like protein
MKKLGLLVMFVAVGTMLSGCVSTGDFGAVPWVASKMAWPVSSQSAVSAGEAEKITEVLTKLETQWTKASITKDTAFLKSIWADDLRFTDEFGKVNDKEAALADFEGNTDTVTSGVISDYKVRVYGKNFAVVAGDYHVAGKDKDGKPFSRKFRWTGVWVRKQMSTGERKWQCVSEHGSKLE